MTTTAIVSDALIPMRAEPSHKAEMISQLLFGDKVVTLEEKENWVHVYSLDDHYPGWVLKANIQYLATDLASAAHLYVNLPVAFAKLYRNNFYEPIFLHHGSKLLVVDKFSETKELSESNLRFTFFKLKISLDNLSAPMPKCGASLVKNALSYLNTPYLWGGITHFGCDCSGLVQMVYRLSDVFLPRDANMQANCGALVSFEAKQAGDLAFFANDNGKITHVGMVLENDQIIHASERVQIGKLTREGIFELGSNKLTHLLHSIRAI